MARSNQIRTAETWIFVVLAVLVIVFGTFFLEGNLTGYNALTLNDHPVNFAIKDRQGNQINSEIFEVTASRFSVSASVSGFKKVQITPLNHKIKKLIFENLEIKEDLELTLDEMGTELYAIDPTKLNFTTATVFATASENSTSLFKCTSWNFTSQECDNLDCSDEDEEDGLCNQTARWVKVMDLVPGQEYSFNINSTDPGFYEGGESVGESSTISETYVNKVSKTFTPDHAGYYLILASAEARTDTTSYSVKVRTTLDGTIASEAKWEPQDADWYDDYQTFFTHKIVYLDAASHTINMDYLLTQYDCRAYIRNARISVIDLADYEFTEVEAEQDLNQGGSADCPEGQILICHKPGTSAEQDYCVDPSGLSAHLAHGDFIGSCNSQTYPGAALVFNLTEAGNYLILATGEYQSGSVHRTVFAELKIDGIIKNEARYEAKDPDDYKTFGFHNISYLSAGPHAIKVKGSGEDNYGKMRRVRIAAIRMTNDFDYHSAESNSESTTSSTSLQDKTVLTFTPSQTADYLCMATAEIGSSSTERSVTSQLEINGKTYADMRFEPHEASSPRDYTSFATTQNYTFDNAPHTVKIRYKTESGATAYIRNARVTCFKITPTTQPPIVNLMGPPDGSFDANGKVVFRYNVTDIDPISSCSLVFDGDAVDTSLLIAKNVKQEFEVLNLPEGTYDWYINCTDSSGNTGMSETWTLIIDLPDGYTNETLIINETIEDANGNPIEAIIELIDTGSGEVDTNTTSGKVENISAGSYDIKITPVNSVIKQILIHDVDVTDDILEIVDIDDPPETEQFQPSVYAVDPSRATFGFEYINVSLVAEGRHLFKCANWDYHARNCTDDRWKKIQTIYPGNDYTVQITSPLDPGFGESNNSLNVLDTEYYLINNYQTILSDLQNIIDVNITLDNHIINSIYVENHNLSPFIDDLILDDPENGHDFRELYVIDPTNAALEELTVTLTASAHSQTLSKCLNWSFENNTCNEICVVEDNESSCEDWVVIGELNEGEAYSFTINQTDPAFSETSEAADVAVAPVDLTTFIVAWVDADESDVSYKVMDINGTEILSTVDVDTTTSDLSRVDISLFNETHFVLGWNDEPVSDVEMGIFTIYGDTVLAETEVDIDTGTRVDVSVTELGDRYVLCYANDDDNDADFQIFDNQGNQLVGESRVDNNMNPNQQLHNLIECRAINSTRWIYAWYDDGSDDITLAILDENGNEILGNIDIDTNAGPNGEVTVTPIDDDKFAIAYFDDASNEITIAIRDLDNNIVLPPTDIDTNAGSQSRIASTTVRENATAESDSFVVVWWDSASTDIKAAVYNGSGSEITAPFVVETQPDSTYRLLDVTARDTITNNTLCPGTFVVAYTNSTDFGVFKGYHVNGSEWKGGCPTGKKQLKVMPLSPPAGSVYNISTNVTISANVTTGCSVDTAYADVTLPNGTIFTLDLDNVGGDTYLEIFENKNLIQKGRYNVSFFANDTCGNVNNTATTYFIREAPENRIFDVTNISLNYFGYTTAILENNSGILKLNISLDSPKIKNIIVYGYDEKSPYSLIRLESDANDDLIFDYQYVVDLSAGNLTSADVTLVASGYHLFKCLNFNQTSLQCNDSDEYEQIMTGLVPGQTYTISLTKTDPVFGETIQGAENTSDSYIRENRPNNNYGGATFIRTGKSFSSNSAYRGTIWFNLSHVNSTVNIESANLSLYFFNIPFFDTTGIRTHGVHKVQQSPARPWEELEITWNNYINSNAWTTAGGDYNATPTDTEAFSSVQLNTWISYNITSDVQDFINNPIFNFGWIIRDQNETTTNTRRDYRSSEYWIASQRPKLEIIYDTTSPIVQLASPPNASTDDDGEITFEYNVTDRNQIDYCNLFVNGSLVQANFTVVRDTTQNFLQFLANGSYEWHVNCTDIFGNTGMSEIWKFNVSISGPVPFTTGCCCVLDVSATPEVVNTGEKVLISADVSSLFSGGVAKPADVSYIKTTIYRIDNGTNLVVVNNASMTYLSDGLWFYEFNVGNNATGTYIASVIMKTNQTTPFIKEASDTFTIGEVGGSGLTITGVSPDLVNANKTVRLAAEIKYNGMPISAGLITSAGLLVEQINGTTQIFLPVITDGLIYVDGTFNESGVYYLDWNTTYQGIGRAAREIVVVVDWDTKLDNLNISVNFNASELVSLIKESRQYLLELLTDMEYLQQFTEEEVFLITDSVNSMSKVVSFLENGDITAEEAERQFNEIRSKLMGTLGEKLTGSVIAEGKLEGDSLLNKLSKDWRFVMFIMLLLILAVLVGVVVFMAKISRMITYPIQSSGKPISAGQRTLIPVKPMAVPRRRYEIFLDNLKEKFVKKDSGITHSNQEEPRRRYELILNKIKEKFQKNDETTINKPKDEIINRKVYKKN